MINRKYMKSVCVIYEENRRATLYAYIAARRNLHHTGFIVNLIPLPTFQFTKI